MSGFATSNLDVKITIKAFGLLKVQGTSCCIIDNHPCVGDLCNGFNKRRSQQLSAHDPDTGDHRNQAVLEIQNPFRMQQSSCSLANL